MYRMAGKLYALLYQPGEPLEYGDFKTHDNVRAAKRAAEEVK